jgi:hypothetical protein
VEDDGLHSFDFRFLICDCKGRKAESGRQKAEGSQNKRHALQMKKGSQEVMSFLAAFCLLNCCGPVAI